MIVHGMVGAFKNIKRLLSKAQSVGLTHPQCGYFKNDVLGLYFMEKKLLRQVIKIRYLTHKSKNKWLATSKGL